MGKITAAALSGYPRISKSLFKKLFNLNNFESQLPKAVTIVSSHQPNIGATKYGNNKFKYRFYLQSNLTDGQHLRN